MTYLKNQLIIEIKLLWGYLWVDVEKLNEDEWSESDSDNTKECFLEHGHCHKHDHWPLINADEYPYQCWFNIHLGIFLQSCVELWIL